MHGCGQIGECISNKGGVVSAEELAPFLDVPPYSDNSQVGILQSHASACLWTQAIHTHQECKVE